ncbi:hypothetical protein EVAR_3208_1 [Eumeta japonica]|uniref:Uncharacterized protein n=1 Tax=Eumeta variegata TaxID=151549 RepID=A0A4C1SXC0_EUMVA|nr:hypothetical protein EVAR_3208_1 [Eumeta japonica]
MELPNFQLRYQTLKANHGQSVFHENIKKSKHGWVALFHYEVLATFRFHHQTLETNHAASSDPENRSWSKYISRRFLQDQTRPGYVVSLWSASAYLPSPSSDPENHSCDNIYAKPPTLRPRPPRPRKTSNLGHRLGRPYGWASTSIQTSITLETENEIGIGVKNGTRIGMTIKKEISRCKRRRNAFYVDRAAREN